MDEDHGYEHDVEGGGGWFMGFLIGIAVGLYIIGSPKHEGEKAEYWYNLYADYEYGYIQARNCLDEIINTADYYSYGESYEDMQYAFEEIVSTAEYCR